MSSSEGASGLGENGDIADTWTDFLLCWAGGRGYGFSESSAEKRYVLGLRSWYLWR